MPLGARYICEVSSSWSSSTSSSSSNGSATAVAVCLVGGSSSNWLWVCGSGCGCGFVSILGYCMRSLSISSFSAVLSISANMASVSRFGSEYSDSPIPMTTLRDVCGLCAVVDRGSFVNCGTAVLMLLLNVAVAG